MWCTVSDSGSAPHPFSSQAGEAAGRPRGPARLFRPFAAGKAGQVGKVRCRQNSPGWVVGRNRQAIVVGRRRQSAPVLPCG